mmetsp:Transcript_31045/g.65694  ORF Transcript_31045/g.65694 Transcript_31045/m.65694 type:complete len:563 (+) Transcript_31045:1314-3002(+)
MDHRMLQTQILRSGRHAQVHATSDRGIDFHPPVIGGRDFIVIRTKATPRTQERFGIVRRPAAEERYNIPRLLIFVSVAKVNREARRDIIHQKRSGRVSSSLLLLLRRGPRKNERLRRRPPVHAQALRRPPRPAHEGPFVHLQRVDLQHDVTFRDRAVVRGQGNSLQRVGFGRNDGKAVRIVLRYGDLRAAVGRILRPGPSDETSRARADVRVGCVRLPSQHVRLEFPRYPFDVVHRELPRRYLRVRPERFRSQRPQRYRIETVRHPRLPQRQHLPAERDHLRVRRVLDVHVQRVGGDFGRERGLFRILVESPSGGLAEDGTQSARGRAEGAAFGEFSRLPFLAKAFRLHEARREFDSATRGGGRLHFLRRLELDSQHQPVGVQDVLHSLSVDAELSGAVSVKDSDQIVGQDAVDVVDIVLRLARQRIDNEPIFAFYSLILVFCHGAIALSVGVPCLSPIGHDKNSSAKVFLRFFRVHASQERILQRGDVVQVTRLRIDVGRPNHGMHVVGQSIRGQSSRSVLIDGGSYDDIVCRSLLHPHSIPDASSLCEKCQCLLACRQKD